MYDRVYSRDDDEMEWSGERETRKSADEKDKDKEKGKEKEKDASKDEAKNVKAAVPSPSSSSLSTPGTPAHQKYTLHRDIFALRLAEHRKQRQTAQAKELAPRLPGAPRGSLPSSAPDV